MPVSLVKGGTVSLSKEAPGLKMVTVGLGWDVRVTDGAEFDLDSSAFLLNGDGKVSSGLDMVFYSNLKSQDGSVEHGGDNRAVAGEGDVETISVNLEAVAAEIQKIAVAVTIHEAAARRQNFGQVSRAFMRVSGASNGQEIARFDLSEDMSSETAMIFGEIYRHGAEWMFKAIGRGFRGGLGALAGNFGLDG